MPLPDTFTGLQEYGYRYLRRGRCGSCHAKLEWFLTRLNKQQPFSYISRTMIGEETTYQLTSETKLEPHHAVCPFAFRYRRKGA